MEVQSCLSIIKSFLSHESDNKSESPIKRIFVLCLFVTRKVRCQVRNLMRNPTPDIHLLKTDHTASRLSLKMNVAVLGNEDCFLAQKFSFPTLAEVSLTVHSAHL